MMATHSATFAIRTTTTTESWMASNCPLVANPNQVISTSMASGDVCDTNTGPSEQDQCKNGGVAKVYSPVFKNQGQVR